MSTWLPHSPATLATLMIVATSVVVPSLPSQDSETKDPWFATETDQGFGNGTTTSKSDEEPNVVLRTKNPNALARQLKKKLDDVPEANLTKRIGLLQEIVSLTPRKTQDERELLDELESKKTASLGAIAAAGNGELTIEESIERLGPHARYLRGDTSLLLQLLQTPLTQRLDARVRFLGSENNVAALGELDSLISNNGLGPILSSRIKYSATDSLANTFLQKWKELSRGTTLLPGEAFLLGQILESDELKLRVGLDVVSSTDERLISNITRSMESDWGDKVEFVPTQRRADLTQDLTLTIQADSIQTSRYETSNTVASMIPGSVVEEPNPDFLDLVERYEKAAKKYEIAAQTYEMQYEQYLSQFEDSEYDRAQQQLSMAEENLRSTPATDQSGNVTQEYESARADFQLAQSLANSVSPTIMPEPMKPEPRHLKILEDLYLVPSTIITSEEKTPYEYETKNLEYEFETKADLALETPIPETTPAKANVSLSQLREWTKNEGVDPRDPVAGDGSFNQADYNSALDLFSLEFGSRCSDEFRKLLSDAANSINEVPANHQSLPQAILAIAISYTKSGQPQPLSQEDLSELTTKLNSGDTSLSEIRATYLSIILRNSEFAALADQEAITAAL